MKNDTAVFAAMCMDALTGESVWIGLTGTHDAILRDRYQFIFFFHNIR
jgi:hypothetical protein